MLVIESNLSKCDVDYGIRSKINWTDKKNKKPVAELHTKRSDGLELVMYFPAGEVTIGAIAAIGEVQEIERTRDGLDAVRLRFTKMEQLNNKDVVKMLIECSKR